MMAQQHDPTSQANYWAHSVDPSCPCCAGRIQVDSMSMAGQPTLPTPTPSYSSEVRASEMQSTVRLSPPEGVSRALPNAPDVPSYTDRAFENMSVVQDEALSNFFSEMLHPFPGDYDPTIASQLLSFNTALDRLTEDSNIVPETFASTSAKLDYQPVALDEKFSRLTQDIDMKLDGWRMCLDDSVKSLVKEAVTEASNNTWTDRERNLVRMLGVLLDNAKRTQDRFNSLDKSLVDTNSSIKSLASRQISLDGLTEVLEMQIRQNTFDIRPDYGAYTRGLAQLHSEYTRRAAYTEEFLGFVKTSMEAVRDEAHAGKAELAEMIGKTLQIENGQLKMLEKDVCSLKSAVGIEDTLSNPNGVGMEVVSGSIEGRQIHPSLAARMDYLERGIKEQTALLRLLMGKCKLLMHMP